VDAQLGAVLDHLRDDESLDEILVCVTSGSGLPLGEHGFVGFERPWLHEELVHLPLILRLPEATEAGLRVAALTQPVDLWPTLLKWGSPEWAGHGFSLWPLIRGDVAEVRPYACSAMSRHENETNSQLARASERVQHSAAGPFSHVRPTGALHVVTLSR
jgi:arylsulfatase A-like enzyme